ncbi:MAG: hypothetical protein [Caudoviricetes sp.]|nr:MAG: hypothetical protein [Caudoviricetes sp.]
MSLDPNNFVAQMRLNTGDFQEDEYYLEDAVYVHFFRQAGNSVIEGSILALESIIANIALSPIKWTLGDSSETAPQVVQLNERLIALKKRKNNNTVPVLISSDRKSWCDFDKVFGSEYK